MCTQKIIRMTTYFSSQECCLCSSICLENSAVRLLFRSLTLLHEGFLLHLGAEMLPSRNTCTGYLLLSMIFKYACLLILHFQTKIEDKGFVGSHFICPEAKNEMK